MNGHKYPKWLCKEFGKLIGLDDVQITDIDGGIEFEATVKIDIPDAKRVSRIVNISCESVK